MKKINEWNGNNKAYSKNFGGGFIGGSDLSKYAGQLDPYPFKTSKLTGADTLISQRTGLVSTSYEGDYYDDEIEIEEILENIANFAINSILKEQKEKEDRAGQIAGLGKAYKTARRSIEMAKPEVKSAIANLTSKGMSQKEAIKQIAKEEAGAGLRAIGTAKPSFLSRVGLTKVAGMAIPVLDIGIAISLITSSLNKINTFNRNFNDILKLSPGSELSNYLIDANDRQFDELLKHIKKSVTADKNAIGQLKNEFNDILQVFKDLFMAILIAVAPYMPAAAASAVPILGTALGYLAGKGAGIIGALAIHNIPAERILFEISTEAANALQTAFKVFQSEDKFNSAQGNTKRDSLAYCFITNFTKSLARMGKIYTALYEGQDTAFDKALDIGKAAVTSMGAITEIHEYSVYNQKRIDEVIDELNEFENYAQRINTLDRDLSNQRRKEISNLNDQLSEFSGVSALGGSPVTPLGTNAKGERQTVNQQRKRQKFNREKSFPYKRKN